MSSKDLLKTRNQNLFSPRIIFVLKVIIHLSLFALIGFSQTIDRIVAIVNDQVITLTDLKIVEAFGLYKEEIREDTQDTLMLLLERLIDQKLIIRYSGEEVPVEKKEMDSYRKEIIGNIGLEEAKKKLEEFGLNWEDLSEYLREKILYQKIITRRFSQRIIVSLKEIEDYYKQSYLPSQEEKGEEPQPMLEILDEIESIIRQQKSKAQIDNWVKSLKKEAEIQIKLKNQKNWGQSPVFR